MPEPQLNETEILWPEEAMPPVVDEPAADVDFDVDVDVAAEPTEVHEGELPPERVGFVAPVSLRSEGSEAAHEGNIVNLSVRGMACMSPLDLDPGQRLWLTFRLNLAEKPLTLLGEVIWKEPPRHGGWPLGVRFKSLTRSELEALQVTVRERSEGRAGAWPLPGTGDHTTLPHPTRATPWLSAVAGMAAGIALTLAVSMIPRSDPSPAVAEAPTPDAQRAAAAETAAPAPEAPLPPQVAASSAPPAAATVATKRAATVPPEPPAAERSSSDLAVAGSRDRLTVMLPVDGPVGEHVGFWVERPRRYVVDVMQRKSALKQHTYDVQHPMATTVRVGNHDDRVRFVIDTPSKQPLVAQLEAEAHGLRLTLRQK